jgi:hypothetical protein
VALGIGGAAIAASAVWIAVAIRRVLAMLDHGGGVFGSSAGVGLVGYVLPFILTAWLFRRVRGEGTLIRRLRTLYALSMTPLLTVLAFFVSQLFLPRDLFGHGLVGWYVFESFFLVGAVWLPVQAFFAAAFVSVLVVQAPATVENSGRSLVARWAFITRHMSANGINGVCSTRAQVVPI